jgi:hypothetical protein
MNKSDLYYEKEVFETFIAELYSGLEQFYLYSTGNDIKKFDYMFKNEIKKYKLSKKKIEEIMTKSILEVFLIKKEYAHFEEICETYKEDDKFMTFKNILKIKINEIFKEYYYNNHNILENFNFNNHLLKINDNNLKIQYQNAATRLVTQKYK